MEKKLKIQVSSNSDPRFVIDTLTESTQVSELLSIITQRIGRGRNIESVRCGFPPVLVTLNPTDTLKQANIRSGDSLTVEFSSTGVNTNSASMTSQQSTSNQSSVSPQGYCREIPDDNHCLFRAIAYVCNPTDPMAVSAVRELVGAMIMSDDRFDDATLGMNKATYIQKITQTSAWGGAIELGVLTRIFQVHIWTIDISNGVTFKFNFNDDDGEPQTAQTVMLLYSGIHYDAFAVNTPTKNVDLSNKSDFKQLQAAFAHVDHSKSTTKFNADSPYLQQAYQVASLMKNAGIFTNTAKFTIRCSVCKKGLVGTKEAQNHANTTGHFHFEEYN